MGSMCFIFCIFSMLGFLNFNFLFNLEVVMENLNVLNIGGEELKKMGMEMVMWFFVELFNVKKVGMLDLNLLKVFV